MEAHNTDFASPRLPESSGNLSSLVISEFYEWLLGQKEDNAYGTHVLAILRTQIRLEEKFAAAVTPDELAVAKMDIIDVQNGNKDLWDLASLIRSNFILYLTENDSPRETFLIN